MYDEASYQKAYRAANREKLNAYDRERYRLKGSRKTENTDKNWLAKNPSYFNNYNKKRKAIDPEVKLRMYFRSRLYKALKGYVKTNSSSKLLGCSITEFKLYLESKFTIGMSWDNYGDWHVDHIKALANFDLTNIEQLQIACHYTNMQPLWKLDNQRKGNR